MDKSENLFPLLAYFYREDGKYDAPEVIKDEEALHNPTLMGRVRNALHCGLEVRITDDDDFLVFHVTKGKIIFDGENYYPEGRPI